MTGQNLIDLFDVLTDGLSELSAVNKLALANRKYRKLANEREWEDLRSSDATLTISSNAFSLPSDFKSFVPNEYGDLESPHKWAFYDSNDIPQPIIRFAERKRFTDLSYYDPANSRVVTPDSITGTVTLDYFKTVTALTTGTSPVFTNTDNHSVIAYMMAVEHYSIDQSEQGRSKEGQYQNTVDQMMEDMEYDDNKLKESGADYA